MSDDESNDNELLNITAETVKYLYVKKVLRNIINEAENGAISTEVRLLDYEVDFLRNKNFDVDYMFMDLDYGERCSWYTVKW